MDTNMLVQPPPHSRRVESWVYTVLNPLIEALRREGVLLKKGNLTWRWYSRKCEYLRPIIEYVEDSHRPIYEDFVADNLSKEFNADFENHDKLLAQVEARASRFFDGLMQSNMFRKQVNSVLTEYESGVGATQEYPNFERMKADLPNYIAEYLINRTEVLPPHYVTHQFWKKFGSRFERSEDEFAGYKQRASFRALKKSSSTLEEVSGRLVQGLEAHRLLLCSTYDIPAAPVNSR